MYNCSLAESRSPVFFCLLKTGSSRKCFFFRFIRFRGQSEPTIINQYLNGLYVFVKYIRREAKNSGSQLDFQSRFVFFICSLSLIEQKAKTHCFAYCDRIEQELARKKEREMNGGNYTFLHTNTCISLVRIWVRFSVYFRFESIKNTPFISKMDKITEIYTNAVQR